MLTTFETNSIPRNKPIQNGYINDQKFIIHHRDRANYKFKNKGGRSL